MADKYVCKLNAKSEKIAKDELFEIPSDRLSAVDALRAWIEDQPHIHCQTDTHFLLKFLRTAKFSQLRAREIIQGYLTLKVDLPNYYTNWDPKERHVAEFFKAGVFVPLPGYSKSGYKVLTYRYSQLNVALPKDITKPYIEAMARYWLMLMTYCQMDENVTVTGMLYIMDFTDCPIRALTMWSLQDLKDVMRYQDNVAGRFKGFWFYNPGTFADAILGLFKPFMKKKTQERIRSIGSNLEKIYAEVPLENLPDEYLPDDYTGPRAGSYEKLARDFYNDITKPETLKALQHESDPKWHIKKSEQKLQKADMEHVSSFRKLTID